MAFDSDRDIEELAREFAKITKSTGAAIARHRAEFEKLKVLVLEDVAAGRLTQEEADEKLARHDPDKAVMRAFQGAADETGMLVYDSSMKAFTGKDPKTGEIIIDGFDFDVE